jgi:predicted dehydrogenase/threonine dehydrogenase-like Zn-dependent dehydrogenase
MKQILQSARTGEIEIAEVPAPRVLPGCVLVRIVASLVSAGTERASSEFASKSLLQKAKSRPDLVREVVNKVRRDGVLSAFSAVRSRLDQPLALGYSSAGTVVEVGEGISDLRVGDRVACAGANFAVHAEFACMPRMLVARIPSADVDFDSAAFTTLGAVAIHGVRTAEAKLGDVVAVIGLGLLGQLTLQVLNAAGCRVVGMDLIQERAELAAKIGALAVTTSEAEFRDLCLKHSAGHGADSVLITAETASSGPVNLASEVARDRGIVVAVGAVGMELQRKLYYAKELDFRVSRSYGPGRYDIAFEQKGRDYPIGYVRWSETRNMEAFLQLHADGKLNLRPLITHSLEIENATAAYELITGQAQQPYLGVVIRYPQEGSHPARRMEIVPRQPKNRLSESEVRVGLLGAGNFAQGTLIPAMRQTSGTKLVGLCASSGARAHSAAAKFGFAFCTTDEEEPYSDPAINTVVIATRHHLHAVQVVRALERGKHVFCEKPLCLTEDELDQIEHAYYKSAGTSQLMVGFNRRFAPMARRMKSFLEQVNSPFAMHYRVNAGPLPKDHWINDPEQGGGRILGEVCHFVDFLSFICGAAPHTVHARSVSPEGGEHSVAITIEFADGSLGNISYVCNGDRTFSKERAEMFGGGCVAVLDDFRRLELVRHGSKRIFRSWLKQDKGHAAEWAAFSECIRSGRPAPIPFEEIVATTLATIRIAASLRSGQEQQVIARGPHRTATPLVS